MRSEAATPRGTSPWRRARPAHGELRRRLRYLSWAVVVYEWRASGDRCSGQIRSFQRRLFRPIYKMLQRLAYRRRKAHRTNSNPVKIVKTPGGRLVFQHVKKRYSLPSCRHCMRKLPGLIPMRPADKRICTFLMVLIRGWGDFLYN